MTENNPAPRRKFLRLPNYDYTTPDAYFMTVCSHRMHHIFGRIADGVMHLNEAGWIMQEEWLRTAEVRPNIELDAFVMMPNHFHGILIITGDPEGGGELPATEGTTHRVARTGAGVSATGKGRPRGPASGSVGAIVGQFKSHAARRINRVRGTPGAPVWKRNYYEHIFRSDRASDRLRDYVDGNPALWQRDALYARERIRA